MTFVLAHDSKYLSLDMDILKVLHAEKHIDGMDHFIARLYMLQIQYEKITCLSTRMGWFKQENCINNCNSTVTVKHSDGWYVYSYHEHTCTNP